MFDVIGIICLVICAVFIIIGFINGFLSLFLGLAKGLVAVILAALLCKPIGVALCNTGIGTGISNKIETSLVNMDPAFNEIITNENKDEFIETQLTEKLAKLNLPNTITKYISNLMKNKVNISSTDGITCGQYIGKGVAMFVSIIIAFIIISILLVIIFWILQKFAKKINLVPFVGLANRLCGAALGLGIALIITSMLSYVVSLLMVIPWNFAETIKESLKLGQEEFTIGKFFYEHNALKWIINLIFS